MRNGVGMRSALLESVSNHVGTAAPGCPVERSSTGFLPDSAAEMSEGSRSAKAFQLSLRLAEQLKSCLRILTAVLRELFDESGYARFLDQKRLLSSRAAYAAFRQENEVAKARRPRCC